ncbi:MAG: winged helix-turn-helix domain-containing protein, partial [Alphaproteobacteria bacterium]
MTDPQGPASRTLAFGPFRLMPARQLLLDGDVPVRLGSRALDILVALAERQGELVGKDELAARVWPGTIVGEASLRVHVSALRKALGDAQSGERYIANVPGRGYRFVAPVQVTEAETPAAPVAESATAHNLPAPTSRLVGRDDVVRAVTEQIAERRFVTIVGAGGIGKTTVAVAAAGALIGHYPDGVWFVDLARVTDPGHVASAIAAELGVPVVSDVALPGLVAHLAGRRTLLLLDSCEHVVDAAAAVAEAVLAGADRVHILATSREALRATGEHVHRLAPLAAPENFDGITPDALLGFPAAQLFTERASAEDDGFALTVANAPLVGEICRRLDGIALAIELAAARVAVFGVAGLAARLDDRMRLLTSGRRVAVPRHRTLRATLDW